jgi:hypothetical protein
LPRSRPIDKRCPRKHQQTYWFCSEAHRISDCHVFLPVFRRIFPPGPGRLAGLHILIFVTTITLLGNWNDRRMNHLAAASGVALRFQMLAKTLEQFLNETGLRKRLPEQPKRRAVGNAVLDAEPQKPRERGLRPALLFFLLAGVNVAASISARKLSNAPPDRSSQADRPSRKLAQAACPHQKSRIDPSYPHPRILLCGLDSHKFRKGRYFSSCPIAFSISSVRISLCRRLFMMIKKSKSVPFYKFVTFSKLQIFAHHFANKFAE